MRHSQPNKYAKMLLRMHLLRSKALGTEIIDNIDHHVQGRVADFLIDADRGKILAIFVKASGMSDLLILQTEDIVSWGNRVHIRDAETIGEISDFIRLQKFLQDERSVIGQRIVTKNGIPFGKCIDIQFRTDTFDVEWIFPRKFFRKGPALPSNEILEITTDAIIVKDQGLKEEKIEAVKDAKNAKLETVVSPAVGMHQKSGRQAKHSVKRYSRD
jgi:sporulation protein YlmC with PRC-barrel domain